MTCTCILTQLFVPMMLYELFICSLDFYNLCVCAGVRVLVACVYNYNLYLIQILSLSLYLNLFDLSTWSFLSMGLCLLLNFSCFYKRCWKFEFPPRSIKYLFNHLYLSFCHRGGGAVNNRAGLGTLSLLRDAVFLQHLRALCSRAWHRREGENERLQISQDHPVFAYFKPQSEHGNGEYWLRHAKDFNKKLATCSGCAEGIIFLQKEPWLKVNNYKSIMGSIGNITLWVTCDYNSLLLAARIQFLLLN